ncbi:MAG TPA: hypothetical protein VHR72_06805 [Gemmataceae bacterium]|nr:hypothetical protein [Gemmataceae bacterium]
MLPRIFDPRLLTMAVALLIGAATLQAEPGAPTPNSPHPTKKSAADRPSTKTKNARKTKNVPAKLARVTHHSRNYRGWSKFCWFPRYQCYGYYSASQRMWFYYYEPFARFLPTRYLSTYPPTTVGNGPVTTAGAAAPGATAPAGAASAALPAGATAIPASAPAPAPADAPTDAPADE